jgi:hypothetical protein
MPQFVNHHELKEFNSILQNIAKVDKKTITAIFHYMTGASSSKYNEEEAQCLETIINAAAGE